MKRIAIWIRKPLDGFIIDRRAIHTCKIFALWTISVLCFGAASVMASNSTGESSLTEHALAIMDFQWWIIGGLFTIAGGALVLIYSSGRKVDRAQFSVLFEKIDDIGKKFDRYITDDQHKQIDHSMLCPKCRKEG